MLNELKEVMQQLPELVAPDQFSQWKSLFINYEKPYVKRLWRPYGGHRLNIHIISPCGPGEALYHPHPWPSATAILTGGYEMDVGFGPQLEPPPVACTLKLRAGSSYEMLHPNGWHAIRPHMTTLSVMLTGKPWNRNCIPVNAQLEPLNSEECEDIFGLLSHVLLMPRIRPED